MALCQFIYGVIEKYLCFERVVYVRYVSIDHFVITTPLKKRYSRPLVMLWSTWCISVGERCRRFAAEPLHDLMTAQMAARLTLRSFKHKKRKVSNSSYSSVLIISYGDSPFPQLYNILCLRYLYRLLVICCSRLRGNSILITYQFMSISGPVSAYLVYSSIFFKPVPWMRYD